MKAFSNPGYMLAFVRVEVKLAYTAFLMLIVIGMLTTGAFQWGYVGPFPADVAIYFRGGERAGAMMFPKSFRELVELTHFHAFGMGAVYLVLAHLIIATTAPAWVKQWSVVVGGVGLAGDLVGVWLIRYVSPLFAYPQVLCWFAQWASFGAFVYYPVRDMWFVGGEDDGG